MTTIRNDLYTFLVEADIVADRIFWGLDTGSVYPCITLALSRKENTKLMPSGLDPWNLQVNIIGDVAPTAAETADATYAALHGAEFANVVGCEFQDGNDTAISINGDPDNILYVQILNFDIWEEV